jgi:predicted aconitase with swiveling domain
MLPSGVNGVINMKTVIKGRGAIKGIAEGEALVCPDSIQGWAGVDDITGIIIEKGHVAEGESIADKILVIPSSKGPNCWSGHFNSAMINGNKPAGWVVTKMDSRVGVTAVVVGTPMVADFKDEDPCIMIKTGDWVKVDGNTGEVEITKKKV